MILQRFNNMKNYCKLACFHCDRKMNRYVVKASTRKKSRIELSERAERYKEKPINLLVDFLRYLPLS